MAGRRHRSDSEETSYWLSYSDMMAALLLIFVLIITFTMLQAKVQFEEKEDELLAQQILLGEQQALMEEQREIMAMQQAQLDRIIGMRSGLIAALKDEFDGTDLKVKVDPQTGAITLDSSILFDTDKYDLKSSGQEFLKEFLPRYLSVLLDSEFSNYVAEIIIEGHTDTNGTYLYNLGLSQERALSVAAFCLRDGNGILSQKEIESLRKIVTANGRAYSDPIYSEDHTVNMEASRRVEFKFRLKDEDMVEEMSNILSNED